ncbi:TRL-like family protein, partial [Helicobacter typhlonius]|uniref:TRL-like family protein n=3 Tax=Helicobacter typhlonius TaxID=76936 RepID=UPI002FE1F9AA
AMRSCAASWRPPCCPLLQGCVPKRHPPKHPSNLGCLGFGGAVALFSGCAIGSTAGLVSGVLYSDMTGPVAATSTGGDSKQGQAKCSNILGLVSVGNCSVDAAAKAGNISQIKSVDTKIWSILGLYTTSTTIVKGN